MQTHFPSLATFHLRFNASKVDVPDACFKHYPLDYQLDYQLDVSHDFTFTFFSLCMFLPTG